MIFWWIIYGIIYLSLGLATAIELDDDPRPASIMGVLFWPIIWLTAIILTCVHIARRR